MNLLSNNMVICSIVLVLSEAFEEYGSVLWYLGLNMYSNYLYISVFVVWV